MSGVFMPPQILLVSDYFYAYLRREHHLTHGLYLKKEDGTEATLVLKWPFFTVCLPYLYLFFLTFHSHYCFTFTLISLSFLSFLLKKKKKKKPVPFFCTFESFTLRLDVDTPSWTKAVLWETFLTMGLTEGMWMILEPLLYAVPLNDAVKKRWVDWLFSFLFCLLSIFVIQLHSNSDGTNFDCRESSRFSRTWSSNVQMFFECFSLVWCFFCMTVLFVLRYYRMRD